MPFITNYFLPQMLEHTVQRIGEKMTDYWAVSGCIAPICEKGELNIYSNQNIKAMEEVLSSRASSMRPSLKSVASLHEDFCTVRESNSVGSESGGTDNGSCGNENCNKQSLKSINSINTRKPVTTLKGSKLNTKHCPRNRAPTLLDCNCALWSLMYWTSVDSQQMLPKKCPFCSSK